MTLGANVPLLDGDDATGTWVLRSPTAMPHASAYLWNRQMMIQVSCRGYAVAQFMQPEPGKYAHGPSLEAKTFLQPEQPFYAHHPGRFVYVKDEENGALFSVPYEPVRARLDHFEFVCSRHSIEWFVAHAGLGIRWTLTLPRDRAAELWRLSLTNESERRRRLSVYPYFPIGYMSWMNQSGTFQNDLVGVVARSVTPYQKYTDYPRIRGLKDSTYFIANEQPEAFEVRQAAFEGEGGLHAPTGVARERLSNGEAQYETPAAALQYRVTLDKGAAKDYRFVFGPARDEDEVRSVKRLYFGSASGFDRAAARYADYVDAGEAGLQIETPDQDFDRFVNHWLARQIYYHGESHRLTTDPQTRNYLQDNMGLSYIRPSQARDAFLRALRQQGVDGAMPDGVLLHEDAELKYINQVPHTDHCVWLPICLSAYLDETGDEALLQEKIGFADSEDPATVQEHVHRAMRWLLAHRDHRGLSYIGQGDWCDPMNMVGPRGRGVSGWLVLATAFALQVWSEVCARTGEDGAASEFRGAAEALNEAARRYLWDGNWYARGITDDGVVFGVASDLEGQIYLNPQSWAVLSGAADDEQRRRMIRAIEARLVTPYGVAMLAPAYTKMREDVGRVTQKYPGSAENGSVYNHAAVFYAYALYTACEADRAFDVLRRMIPGPSEQDLAQRGQLPCFIPNYYRGAYAQFPQVAGRSSQLVHTGTVAWFYRCLIDGLFGVRGGVRGLSVSPCLPSHWQTARVQRRFRTTTFDVRFARSANVSEPQISVEGQRIEGTTIETVEPGRVQRVEVLLPTTAGAGTKA